MKGARKWMSGAQSEISEMFENIKISKILNI